MLVHEIHIFELRIALMNVYSMIFIVFSATKQLGEKAWKSKACTRI